MQFLLGWTPTILGAPTSRWNTGTWIGIPQTVCRHVCKMQARLILTYVMEKIYTQEIRRSLGIGHEKVGDEGEKIKAMPVPVHLLE